MQVCCLDKCYDWPYSCLGAYSTENLIEVPNTLFKHKAFLKSTEYKQIPNNLFSVIYMSDPVS